MSDAELRSSPFVVQPCGKISRRKVADIAMIVPRNRSVDMRPLPSPVSTPSPKPGGVGYRFPSMTSPISPLQSPPSKTITRAKGEPPPPPSKVPSTEKERNVYYLEKYQAAKVSEVKIKADHYDALGLVQRLKVEKMLHQTAYPF